MRRLILIVLLASPFFANSQSEQDSLQQARANNNSYGWFDIFDGNAGKSALYSLVLPGAGQFYNKRYWKVPIVWGVEGFAIAVLVDNIKTYKTANNNWKSLIQGATEIDGVPVTASEYKPFRDNARQNMEWAWVAVGVIHIINVADAFVDRHLIEFDVEDDISFKINTDSFGPNLVINYKF